MYESISYSDKVYIILWKDQLLRESNNCCTEGINYCEKVSIISRKHKIFKHCKEVSKMIIVNRLNSFKKVSMTVKNYCKKVSLIVLCETLSSIAIVRK